MPRNTIFHRDRSVQDSLHQPNVRCRIAGSGGGGGCPRMPKAPLTQPFLKGAVKKSRRHHKGAAKDSSPRQAKHRNWLRNGSEVENPTKHTQSSEPVATGGLRGPHSDPKTSGFLPSLPLYPGVPRGMPGYHGIPRYTPGFHRQGAPGYPGIPRP
jgi:hypothetical protein